MAFLSLTFKEVHVKKCQKLSHLSHVKGHFPYLVSKAGVVAISYFALSILKVTYSLASDFLDRQPSSTNQTCLYFYRNQVSEKNQIQTDIDLHAYRIQLLQNHQISLDEVLDAVLNLKLDVDPNDVKQLGKLINSKWEQSEILKNFERKISIWGKTKSIFSNKKMTHQQKIVQTEFLIRFKSSSFQSFPAEVSFSFFKNLWINEASNKIRTIFLNAKTFSEQQEFVSQFVHLYNTLMGNQSISYKQIADFFVMIVPSDLLYSSLKLAFSEGLENSLVEAVIETAIQNTKIDLTTVLELADRAGLQKTNQKLWKILLLRSTKLGIADQRLLNIYDHWFHVLLKTDFREALNWIRITGPIRKISQNQSENLKLYQDLLAKASSKPARSLVYEELATSGIDMLKLYVGNDMGYRMGL